jgi:ABC-type phosphate/phosphonate transport system substrate-binding protein
VRIGLVNTLFRDTPESMIHLLSRPLKNLMETQTGMTGNLIPAGDSASLAQQLKDDKVQLGVFHGVEFAWAKQRNPNLKALVIAVREKRVLHAYLVVRGDSKIQGFADLSGKAVALPRQSRQHCHCFIDRRCLGCGQPAKSYLSKIATPADAEDALDDVVDGTVQAAIVDGTALERYRRDKEGRAAKLRVAIESEPFPAAVVAYVPGVLGESALQRFHDGMIRANQNTKGKQMLGLCRITCFEDVPADYEQMLLDIAKAYPPPGK